MMAAIDCECVDWSGMNSVGESDGNVSVNSHDIDQFCFFFVFFSSCLLGHYLKKKKNAGKIIIITNTERNESSFLVTC